MQFTKSSFALLVAPLLTSLSILATARPTSSVHRDVWTPRIIEPNNSTVWTSGQTAMITWDTSDAPVRVSDPIGFVLLRFGDIESPVVLADGFDLHDGQVDLTVPNVITGTDFSVVLFGDSGDWSDQFQIIGKTL